MTYQARKLVYGSIWYILRYGWFGKLLFSNTKSACLFERTTLCLRKKDPQQLLSSSTDSIFQSLHEIHYGSSPPIEQSTGIYNSSIIEALLSVTKQSRGNKKAKGAIF